MNDEITKKEGIDQGFSTISLTESETEDENIENILILGTIKEKTEPINYTTLVISGGATKGFFALGALQYAIDHFFLDKIKTFIGTSIGAIICYLLAIGYTARDILVYNCINHVGDELRYPQLVKLLNGEGSFSFDIILKHIEKLTLEKFGRYLTLGDLSKIYEKKLIFSTYNVTKGENEYLSSENYPELPALIAIKMSSCLPWLFEKCHYMNSTYIDGGISDNFPLHLASGLGGKILAINMLPNSNGLSAESEKNFSEYSFHILNVPIRQLAKNQVSKAPENCDIINLVCEDTSFFNFSLETKEKLDFFSKGYRQAKIFYKE
jgi:predicted acylesterase/phospholipase RssA